LIGLSFGNSSSLNNMNLVFDFFLRIDFALVFFLLLIDLTVCYFTGTVWALRSSL
jgi:hypothetical protein